jgi:hypothetical protein
LPFTADPISPRTPGSVEEDERGIPGSAAAAAAAAAASPMTAMEAAFAATHLSFQEDQPPALVGRPLFTCFCFGRGPPQNVHQRDAVNYVNMNRLFSGDSTIIAEYSKYCDRHAIRKFDSDLMKTIHESQQLLVLVHTVVPLLANRRTFVNMMGRFATRQRGEDGGLVDMMQMMRKLQVAGEFDQYFKIPKDDGIPVHYAKRITNRLETRYTSGEEWEHLKHKIPTSA